MDFYNVAIKPEFSSADFSYFIPNANKKFNFYNCILTKNVTNFFRNNPGENKLTNCYGGFTSGYATTDDMWNYKTNYITTNPKIDSTTYQITDDENTWKNVGTGSNLDGNQANLGVYGGEYSWEYGDDIY